MSFDNFKSKRKSNAWDSQSMASVGEEALEVSPERIELAAVNDQHTLHITNRTAAKLYFRVVPSSPSSYEVRPSQEILSPGQTAQLLFRSLAPPSPAHSFQLEWAPISEAQVQSRWTPVPTHSRCLSLAVGCGPAESLPSLLRVPILVSVAAVSFLIGFVTA